MSLDNVVGESQNANLKRSDAFLGSDNCPMTFGGYDQNTPPIAVDEDESSFSSEEEPVRPDVLLYLHQFRLSDDVKIKILRSAASCIVATAGAESKKKKSKK